jgi:hypothetical protein
MNQAAVAVGEEPIARGDGVAIGRAHALAAGEGRDQHEQSRLRQVEIGQQQVDDAETEAGQHVEPRLARPGLQRAILAATVSSTRSAVVPTATTRPPAARAAAIAAIAVLQARRTRRASCVASRPRS